MKQDLKGLYMKLYGATLIIGMMLLLGVAGVGCGSDQKEVGRLTQQTKDQQVQTEELKQKIKGLEAAIKQKDTTILVLWVVLPLVSLVMLFVGTALGLQGKKDAQQIHGVDSDESQS